MLRASREIPIGACADPHDFESRLFDQLEYSSVTESLYQQLKEKSIPNHFINCSRLYWSM